MYLDERHTSDSTACPGDRGASGEERLPASQTWLWPDSPLGSGPQDLGGGQDQLLKHHVAPWECGHGKCGFRAHSEDRQGPGKWGGRPWGAGRAWRSSRCVHLVLRRASGTVGGAWGQPGQGRKPMPELAGASPCPQDRRNRAAARRVPTPLPPGLTSPVHVTSDSGRQPSPRQVASGRALCRAGGTAGAGAAALGGF